MDTVDFFPSMVLMPITASKDMATMAMMELTHTILHLAPASPFSSISYSHLQALYHLYDTHHNHASPAPRTSNATPTAHVPAAPPFISLVAPIAPHAVPPPTLSAALPSPRVVTIAVPSLMVTPDAVPNLTLLMIVQSLGWLRFYSFAKPDVLLDYSLEVR
jgi:hypothetical protein